MLNVNIIWDAPFMRAIAVAAGCVVARVTDRDGNRGRCIVVTVYRGARFVLVPVLVVATMTMMVVIALPASAQTVVVDQKDFAMLLLGVLLGLLVPVVGVCAAKLIDWRQGKRLEARESSLLNDYISDGRLNRAYTATGLVPWVLGMGDLKGCRIQVWGSDGTYINQENGDVWSNGLRAWIERGLDVDYLLLTVDEPTRQRYIALMNELNRDGDVRLRVKVVQTPEHGYPDDVTETVEDLHTCHPTLLYGSNQDKWAMWIEGDHQPNSKLAYDVWYVPPKAMDNERKTEFKHYEDQIEKIKPYCVDLVAVKV